jgi:hypothetical protein
MAGGGFYRDVKAEPLSFWAVRDKKIPQSAPIETPCATITGPLTKTIFVLSSRRESCCNIRVRSNMRQFDNAGAAFF